MLARQNTPQQVDETAATHSYDVELIWRGSKADADLVVS